MKTLDELTVKALSLKTRVALLGAPLGNKNAAGPHDGIPGNDSAPHIPAIRAELKSLYKTPIAELKKQVQRSHRVVDVRGADKHTLVSMILRSRHGDRKVDEAIKDM